MDIREKWLRRDVSGGGNTSLLRVGVVFLSIVSFFTTANGMKEYIFVDNGPIAYAASAAIQGILLALSMNLPGYLGGIWGRPGAEHPEDTVWMRRARWVVRGAVKLTLSLCVLVLTAVTIFCSSWFSYVYIADVIHRDSWGVDSELLVQQTYREQLYDARDYAHVYRMYLEDSIGERILLLEQQTEKLPDVAADQNIDWAEERREYRSEDSPLTSAYMATVIGAMEAAMAPHPSQNARELAVSAVADARTNISNRITSVQETLNTLDGNITRYNNQVNNLNRQINNAVAGTDVGPLQTSINRYLQLISDATEQQAELNAELAPLDKALRRLPYYESLLGLSSSTSAISIRTLLVDLQSKFFQKTPDVEEMLRIASDIFEKLGEASRTLGGGQTGEEQTGDLSYTALMVQMNQLIRNLTDYAEIKDIENSLEIMITELRQVEGSAPNLPAGPEDPAGQSSPTDDKDKAPEEAWKQQWRKRLAELKAQISAIPVYSGGETEAESGILTEAQRQVLVNYDRNQAGKLLDDMIRRYISSRSAIYNGIIYLQSPYWGLAAFALALALAFDLSGFVFGFAVQGSQEDGAVLPRRGRTAQPQWSILETLQPYAVLTGDYSREDGVYHYRAFKDGLLFDWAVRDAAPYPQGIYRMLEEGESAKGEALPAEGQQLLFAHQAETPADGVYQDCRLTFDEGSLLLVRGDRTDFLAGVDEYMPVHSYHPDLGENQTVPAKQLAGRALRARTAVVALNAKGTRVAAVYAIAQEEPERPAPAGESGGQSPNAPEAAQERTPDSR